MFDLVFYICDVLAHCVLFALDLQFLYFCMVLCKRYRLVNKVVLRLENHCVSICTDINFSLRLQFKISYMCCTSI